MTMNKKYVPFDIDCLDKLHTSYLTKVRFYTPIVLGARAADNLLQESTEENGG